MPRGEQVSTLLVMVAQMPTQSLSSQTPPTLAHALTSYVFDNDDLSLDDDEAPRPFILVLSANDAGSLNANIKALTTHMINPRVKARLSDLAYTLSKRRTKLWHRAYITTQNTALDDRPDAWHVAKKSPNVPIFGFVFTGQGAQWPQMGRDLLQFFPWTRKILEE